MMKFERTVVGIIMTASLILPGCNTGQRVANVGEIYRVPASSIGETRTPVVVLPGILGSKLESSETGKKMWGAFTFGATDVDKPDGARLFAIPMQEGVPLSQLRDEGYASDVLDYIVADVGIFRNLEFGAYVDIMATLAVGKYRDQNFGESGAVDYGGLHYTCFQYPYDWRRDVSEMAIGLHQKITDAQAKVRIGRGLADDAPVKVDVVAHSMGGLVLRYYLRYGTQSMPNDGTLPELTWAGAENVRRAVLVGTPNAGSVESVQQLTTGLNLNPLFPNYRPGIIGTFPSIYQLLPRDRHGLIVSAETGEPIPVLDISTWEKYEWGLLDPDEDQVLKRLLPDVDSKEQRYAIARDHLQKCLDRADQFFRALDYPVTPPEGTTLYLFAGDSEDTEGVLEVAADGSISVQTKVPGDGTVTRSSALMDERLGTGYMPNLRSPIDWDRVQFINADHLGLTRDVGFVDNLLYLLLEDPGNE